MIESTSTSTVIETIEQLKAYLQIALQLEHATIPPYLTAAYSANVEANSDSIGIIIDVAKEEMLHLTLVGNLMNAIGGEPDFISPGFVRPYPTPLPTGQDDFEVDIGRFSDATIATFLEIERPTTLEPKHAVHVEHVRKTVCLDARHVDQDLVAKQTPMVPARPVAGSKYELDYNIVLVPHHDLTEKRKNISDAGLSLIPHVRKKAGNGGDIKLHYWSIGEFYKAIHLGFVELSNQLGEENLFVGDPRRQVGPEHYYSGGGELTVVTDLKSALVAIDLIAGQGEGSEHRMYDDEGELAHYYRFDQIRRRRYYRTPKKNGTSDQHGNPRGLEFPVKMTAVFPIRTNAKLADFRGDLELETEALLFNGRYKRFLERLHEAFNGKPEVLGGAFTTEMFKVKEAMERLIHHPIPGSSETAAPTFEMDKVLDPWADGSDRLEIFLRLSVQLCGLSRFDLLGTGYARRYLETVEHIVGVYLMLRLLQAFAALPQASFHERFAAAIVDDPEFGPVARNITKLWFTATWFELPEEWRKAFGTHPDDRTHVPYPYAYAESLLGPSVGAHPAGAKPTGHQSWPLAPKMLRIPSEC